MHVESVSNWAPAMIGPYSQMTANGSYLSMAGMIGLVSFSMKMAGEVDRQRVLAKRHIEAVLGSPQSTRGERNTGEPTYPCPQCTRGYFRFLRSSAMVH